MTFNVGHRSGPKSDSDQGHQFSSPQYLDLLQGAQVQIGMVGKGRALDDIFTEQLGGTVSLKTST
jgi:putative transposase